MDCGIFSSDDESLYHDAPSHFYGAEAGLAKSAKRVHFRFSAPVDKHRARDDERRDAATQTPADGVEDPEVRRYGDARIAKLIRHHRAVLVDLERMQRLSVDNRKRRATVTQHRRKQRAHRQRQLRLGAEMCLRERSEQERHSASEKLRDISSNIESIMASITNYHSNLCRTDPSKNDDDDVPILPPL